MKNSWAELGKQKINVDSIRIRFFKSKLMRGIGKACVILNRINNFNKY